MTPYQTRMRKFIYAGTAYTLGAPIALSSYEVGHLGWLVYASTAVALYCLAVGFDAVYDSLSEALGKELNARLGDADA
jgi:hypothetical protein